MLDARAIGLYMMHLNRLSCVVSCVGMLDNMQAEIGPAANGVPRAFDLSVCTQHAQ